MRACGNTKRPYTIPLPERLVNFLRGKTAKDILDIGCACGRTCFFLQENGYEVVGVDIGKTQIWHACEEARTHRNNVPRFIVNDARTLCFPNSSFDNVVMLGVLTLVPKHQRREIMNEAYRVLKPSGHLFIEEFGRTWTNPVYAKRYKKDLRNTNEMGTFAIRDETGKTLHLSHHFTRGELLKLLRNFRIVSFEEEVFTSYYHGNWVKGYTILAHKTIE
jgi:ubiquinone/menaquinone biosynthesis C-methylase UbiE